MRKNLADLIKVKTIVTLVVIAVFAVMALTGKLDAGVVMSIEKISQIDSDCYLFFLPRYFYY